MANIFYGIGCDIAQHIDKWTSIAGAPDIFCEKDDLVNKYYWQTKLLGTYDIVSIDEALRRYPEANVWVTYNVAKNTAKLLSAKMPPEKIHFLEADLEYRRGCSYLGNFITYGEKVFAPCCITGRAPLVRYASDALPQRLEQWQHYTEQLIDDIRQDKPNPCRNCQLLRHGFYRKSVKLREINFGTNRPDDVCNFRCTYCFCDYHLKAAPQTGKTTYEILQQLAEIPKYDRGDFTIQLANGEFCANKHCEAMLDIFLQKKWKIALLSNFSIYKEKLATLMEQGKVASVKTSLDAGTRETFKKVKRVDAFDRVVANLRAYPMAKTNLYVKYLFLDGVNDNERDIDGFYEIVKEIGGIFLPTRDVKTIAKPLPEKMQKLLLRFITKAKADGVRVDASSAYLHPQDAKFIRDSYRQA